VFLCVLFFRIMLNSSKERSLPSRSSSLRSHSTMSNQSSEAAVSGTGDAKTPELAIELQHLHELKRQVAAQEQKLVSLRADNAHSENSADACGKIIYFIIHISN